MADENEIDDKAERAIDRIEDLILEMTKMPGVTKAQLDRLARSAGKAADGLDETARVGHRMKELAKELPGLTAGLSRGTTNFTQLSGAISGTISVISAFAKKIPYIGTVLGVAGDAISSATGPIIDSFDRAYSSFEQLSQIGAISGEGIDGMVDNFAQLGLPLQTYQQLVQSNSTRLAHLGGTVGEAADSFTDAAGVMKRTNAENAISEQNLRRLGFSAEEISDTMIQYADIQRRMGLQGYMDQQKLTEGTIAYGRELDAIAKLTGQSRKQLKDQNDAALRNARFNARLREVEATQGREAAENLRMMNLALSNYPELQKGFQDAASGFVSTTEAQKFFITTQGQGTRVIEGVINKQIGLEQGLGSLQQSIQQTIPYQQSLVKATGDANNAFVNFYETSGFATAAQGDLAEAARKARDAQDQQVKDASDNAKNLQKARSDLEQAASNIDLLILKLPVVTSTIEEFSNAIKVATNQIRYRNVEGPVGEAPSLTGARMIVDEIAKTNQILESSIDPATGKYLTEEQIVDLANKLDALKNALVETNQRIRDETSGAQGYKTPRMDRPFLNDTERGAFRERVIDSLVDFYRANQPTAATAAPTEPTSNVTTPSASDVPTAEQLGLSAPVTPQAGQARGAVISGPRSGYQTTLHGTEAVIPLDSTRKIPVEITDSRDSSAALQMMSAQLAKLDDMVSELKRNTDVNEKIFRTRYN